MFHGNISATKVVLPAIGIAALALIFQSEWVSVFLFIVITFGAITFGISCAIYAYLCLPKELSSLPRTQQSRVGSSPCVFDGSKESDSIRKPPYVHEALVGFLQARGKHCQRVPRADTPPPDASAACLPVVFGRMVDAVLQQLLDLALRDFVAPWLQGLCNSHNLIQILRGDIWEGVHRLHERLSRVDQTQLVACRMTARVTAHLERLRLAQAAAARDGGPAVMHLTPHLRGADHEERYLRSVAEVAVLLLLPETYSTNPLVRLLTREILACAILQPCVNMLCDPDYINQKIIAYVKQQEAVRASKRPYEYAASYEDFIRMIKSCDDLETLKHIRYNIVTEIMQAATTVQNLKTKDVQGEKGKADITQARQLKRYINQLTYAKGQCERRLRAMGWRNFPADETASEAGSFETSQLPLQSVLESPERREHLNTFLDEASSTTEKASAFLAYWVAAEKMRHSSRHLWHQLAQELYYTHIHPPSSPLRVDKALRKRMESFLLGDQGPEVFYEVQEDVVRVLEEKYYASFVASDNYQRMLTAMEEASVEGVENAEEIQLSAESGLGPDAHSAPPDQHNYSRRKLALLEEKLGTKRQALQALRTSLKPESRVLAQLEKEVEWLEGEKRQLEAHLMRTETWGEHLGRWRATVQSVEMPEEREPPQFVLVVHVLEDDADSDAVSTGWVVLRRLSHFQELHRKLSQLDAEVKNLDLPSFSAKFLFGKTIDKVSLEKAKLQIQHYLEVVLEDERLNQSEALYTFLSPSSEHLKNADPSPKKTKFSLATLFKSGSGGSGAGAGLVTANTEDSDEEELLLGEEDGRTEETTGPGKDGIAEPLYVLLGEVFDLRGLFRWLRRSLITFVQITYGRTISRQVRDTVAWVFSEPMLHFYTQVFISSWWPHGQLASSAPPRSPQDKMQTRLEARRLFVANVPELLSNLVGQQSARRGALKVFDALQEDKLNKLLFYELLEDLLREIFPELCNQQA